MDVAEDGRLPHLFDGVTTEDRISLDARVEHRRFLPGETLLAQGQPPRFIYVLESGVAEVSRLDPKGDRQLLGHLEADAACGEVSLLTGNPVSATVTAVTEVNAKVMTGQEFFDVAARFPIVYRNVGAILARRLVSADRRTDTIKHGALILLVDHGAPPLLGYALACSIAWHTQTETVMLIQDPVRYQGLLDQGAAESEGGATSSSSVARATVRRPRETLTGSLDAEAAALTRRGVNVLIHSNADVSAQVDAQVRVEAASAKVVHLTGDQSASPANPHGHRVLRGWSQERSGRRTESCAPPPSRSETDQLRAGRLSLETPLGRAVGEVARELCGLRVGWALGEGSAKGFAHLGVLRALERAGIPCDAISGTSIGAAVAGLHAAGISVEAALEHLVAVGSATFRPTLRRGSLMSHAAVERIMRDVWGERTRIEDLDTRLGIVAADIVTGSEIVLTRGLLWAAALASISIPGIYPPQRMDDLLLVDGGVVDPVPSAVVRDLGSDIVIAVRLSAGRRVTPKVVAEAREPGGKVPSVVHTIMRSRDLMNARDQFSPGVASVVIQPDFPAGTGMGLRDFSRGRRFVEMGERAGEAAIPRLVEVLPWLSATH